MEVSTNKSEKVKLDFKDSKYATGRRKTSIAKVWLKKGSGKIYVNGKNYEDYFKRPIHKMQLLRPFDIINQSTNYDVRCNVKGWRFNRSSRCHGSWNIKSFINV